MARQYIGLLVTILALSFVLNGQNAYARDCNIDCNKSFMYDLASRAECHAWKTRNCGSAPGDCIAARTVDPGGYTINEEAYRDIARRQYIKDKKQCHDLADNHAYIANEVCSYVSVGIGRYLWCEGGSALTRKQGHCICDTLRFAVSAPPSNTTTVTAPLGREITALDNVSLYVSRINPNSLRLRSNLWQDTFRRKVEANCQGQSGRELRTCERNQDEGFFISRPQRFTQGNRVYEIELLRLNGEESATFRVSVK